VSNPADLPLRHKYDWFISHASEDKDAVARPLAVRLRQEGYNIWYDEFQLRPGDSLTRMIDYGLANSAGGLLIISPAFIAKPWPNEERVGLNARRLAGDARMVPIWHGVSASEVIRWSPPLADIKALLTSDGLERILVELRRVSQPSRFREHTVEEARELIERQQPELAIHAAFMALDRRVFRLVEYLRQHSLLADDFPDYGSPFSTLKALVDAQLFGGLSCDQVLALEEQLAAPMAFAVLPPKTPEEAEAAVSRVESLLRLNPIPSSAPPSLAGQQ
jgi:hypothetical protein